MNKERRKMIERGRDLAIDAKELIDIALEEEQSCYDNLPEGIQESERGCEMEENIETLQGVSGYLEDAISDLEEIS